MSELSQEARDLIENAIHADDPSHADRTRLRARLAARLGAAAVASTLGTAHSTMASASTGGVGTSAGSMAAPAGGGLLQGVGGLTGLFKVVVATGLAGVIGGSVAWFSQQPERGSQRLEVRAQRAGAGSLASPLTAPAAVTDSPARTGGFAQEENADETRENLGLASVRSRAPRGASTHSSEGSSVRRGVSEAREHPTQSTLGDELSLLARAQRALHEGNPTLALTYAGQHRERFPRGSLREERFGVEALARCALGHEATEVVAALARLSPRSPLLIRVRAACGIPQ